MTPEPTARTRRTAARRFAPWRYLAGYFNHRLADLALVAVLGLVQSLALLPTLALVRFAFDHDLPRSDVPGLAMIGVALLGLRVATVVAALWGRRISLAVTKRAISQMRVDLISTLYALPKDYFAQTDAAETQTRIVLETERVDNLASMLLSSVLPTVCTSLIIGAWLASLNLILLGALGALVPVAWLLSWIGSRRIRREVALFQTDFERFSLGVQFVLRQMDLTRIRGFETQELARQSERVTRLEASGVRMAMSYATHNQTQSALNGVGAVVLLIGGGVAVASHMISMGTLLTFYLAAGLLNGSLNTITGAVPDVIAGGRSLDTLLEIRNARRDRTYGGARRIDFRGRLDICDVSFSFGPSPLLERIDLRVEPEQVTAIFGVNGSGKSTIINLLLGYYRPDVGEIRADGVPFDALDLRSLRREIGVVPQRPTFFTGSIRDNVVYGHPDTSDAELAAALEMAGAHHFVDSLPDGAATLIGENGTRISGGEAQKLAIARALIGSPRLLILDEPTNHLDHVSVGAIMGRIATLPDRPGVLIISHDPLILEFCSSVLALEHGRLAPIKSPQHPRQPPRSLNV